ncbi:MAG: SgcJ/EcaC family oxidoreductase [Candidatus Marinimicrobia bacterium]|jgi:uncharacterized protein (TIGR02246 family)|nr:SgcJ/EcaC family oxidoreductase [Candidatus Neomarinimicrobiota bacterium]
MYSNPFDNLPRQFYTPSSIKEFVQTWLETVCTHNPEAITNLYNYDATLLGTVAENIKLGRSQIRSYFDYFVKMKPCGKITSLYINDFGSTAVANGTYTFILNSDGAVTEVPARFTFVLVKNGGKWLISTHHSSAQP